MFGRGMSDININERLRTVCFTGHRTIPDEDEKNVIRLIDSVIAAAVSRGYRNFVAGGAVGFDTVAACRVIVAGRRIPGISLHLELPCLNQTEKWREFSDIALYKTVLSQANSVRYVTDFY